jgi:hypothetical protein
MNRTFSLMAAALLLSGCGSLNSLLTFQDEEAPVVVSEVAAAPAPPPPGVAQNDWCQRVAASDRLRAQQSGFDPATLDRMALQSLRQCLEFGAR